MIEQGLVKLVQAGLLPAVPACSFAELPKDQVSATNPQAWTYRFLLDAPSYVLAGQTSYRIATVQIDCHGYTAADAINLARSIDGVLRPGFRGLLADADATRVESIVRLPACVDGFSDANRSWVRSLEYEVSYYQQ